MVAAHPERLGPPPVTTFTLDYPPRDAAAAPAARAAGRRLAFLLKDLNGGGVQRMTLAVVRECAERGHAVDLLVMRSEGVLGTKVPAAVRLVPLRRGHSLAARAKALAADPLALPALALPVLLPRRTDWTLAYLGDLAVYLRREAPDALLTATPRLNLVSVWARRLAGTRMRVLLSERTEPSKDFGRGPNWRKRFLPRLMRRTYAQAEAVVAVSNGVADDLARLTGLPRARIRTVYNPVVGPDLARMAAEPVGHRWFRPGEPPVILGAGRLSEQKDFPTLVRAFARLQRGGRVVRLVILGTAAQPKLMAERVAELKGLAESLGAGGEVDLPGYAENPFAYMARSAVFAMSSAWEGFGNVLVEAMACGCPVVSTDCPSGPAEILEGGRYGPLVPVGDDAALALALARVLDAPPPSEVLKARAGEFTVGRATDAYLEALFGRG
jgi:glycosyltransferase involved in cell wall biosynthesis